MIKQNCNSRISGVGSYLPKRRVFSEELMRDAKSESVGVPFGLLEKSTGIIERRFSDLSENYCFLAAQASLKAIVDAAVDPRDIDICIYCGIDTDYPEPSTAHEIQRAIGAVNASCFDISNACLGLLNGLSMADLYISSGTAEVVLICTGERPSDVSLDILKQLKESCSKEKFRKLMGAFTVGDAGGAFVITKSGPGPRCTKMKFSTNSQLLDLCFYKRRETHIEFEMQMEILGRAMIAEHKALIDSTYTDLGWTPADVGRLYCHQVGARPHRHMSSMASIGVEKSPKTYDLYGNLTSATFAVNYDLHRPKPGDNFLFLGAGSGCSICQMGFQY